MDMRSHQAAVRVEAAMNSAPRSATASLLPLALAEPPPELASCAPALSYYPAAGVAGIPSGSTAETNSGFATASPATSPPPATASAPAGSNPEATSGMPLAAAAPEASATAAPATPPKDRAPTIIPAANAASAGSSTPAATAASTQAKPSPVELIRPTTIFGAGDSGTFGTRRCAFEHRRRNLGAPLLPTGRRCRSRLSGGQVGRDLRPGFFRSCSFPGVRGDPGQAVSGIVEPGTSASPTLSFY